MSLRTRVLAEVADVGGGVHERTAAVRAVLGVGRVLERRPRVPMVVDAEGAHAAGTALRDLAEQRVVGVRDECRFGQARQGLAPALRDVLELAIAVELVAEEVGDEYRTRLHAPCHLGQRRLVHLEEAELRIRRREEGGGDPGDEVRARGVVGEPEARPQDLRRHRRRGRLAVRRADHGAAVLESSRQLPDGVGRHAQERLAGQARAAAPRAARERPDRPRRGDLGA